MTLTEQRTAKDSDERRSRQPIPGHRTDRTGLSYTVPAAIVVGFGLVALGIYCGLAARSPAPRKRRAGRSHAGIQAGPKGARPRARRRAPPAPGSARRPREPRPASTVHTRAAFVNRWRAQHAAAAEICQPLQYLEKGGQTWYLELPFVLQIAESGRIRKARADGRARAVLSTGQHEIVPTAAKGRRGLLRCYADEIRKRVRFDPATTSSRLKVWVRIWSAFGRSRRP